MIPIDNQAVIALERVSTGADIHDSNALISRYKWACQRGDEEAADKWKRQMAERAAAIERARSKFADSTVN